MPLVRQITIEHCADVIQDTLEMHLFHAQELLLLRQESHNVQILATHPHVVPMLFAPTEMVLQLVNVFKITLETHM